VPAVVEATINTYTTAKNNRDGVNWSYFLF
jgi:hypothetical protein